MDRPRIAFYAGPRSHEPAGIAKLARADVIVGNKDPATVIAWKAAIRARGGEPEVYFGGGWMLPWVVRDPGPWPWSLGARIAQRAKREDWYLRTPGGSPVGTWGSLLLNVTRGDVREGILREIVYLARNRGQGWSPWVPGGPHYDGMCIEVVMRRVHMDWLRYDGTGSRVSAVDADRDGRADDWERFRANWATLFDLLWWTGIRPAMPRTPLIVGGDAFAPATRETHGLLVEDFGVRRTPHKDFWGVVQAQRGLVYARDRCIDGGVLGARSWRRTIVKGKVASDAEASWLLGVTAMTDGIYLPTADGVTPTTQWRLVYDRFRALGAPIGPFRKLDDAGYRLARTFEHGEVRVDLGAKTAEWRT